MLVGAKTEDDGRLTERVIFPASKELSEQIDDFRFENRIGSKSEAIRNLIEAGLKALHKGKKRG